MLAMKIPPIWEMWAVNRSCPCLRLSEMLAVINFRLLSLINCYLPCLELNTLYAHTFCHGSGSEWNVLCLANIYTCRAMKNMHYFVFHHPSLAVLSKVSIASRTTLDNLATVSQYEFHGQYHLALVCLDAFHPVAASTMHRKQEMTPS